MCKKAVLAVSWARVLGKDPGTRNGVLISAVWLRRLGGDVCLRLLGLLSLPLDLCGGFRIGGGRNGGIGCCCCLGRC